MFAFSVTYVVKESATGFTVEGKGQMELQNEKHPLTYKAEYKTLSKEADGEMGTSFKLNADFQKGVLLTEHKITDKELFYNGKFCKESQCVHTEIRNKLELGTINLILFYAFTKDSTFLFLIYFHL